MWKVPPDNSQPLQLKTMDIFNYNDADLINTAYDKWVGSSKLATNTKTRGDLQEALNNYQSHTLCEEVERSMDQYRGTDVEQQLYRDKRIVDYLIMKLDYPVTRAVDVWSDWEDYCHRIQNA